MNIPIPLTNAPRDREYEVFFLFLRTEEDGADTQISVTITVPATSPVDALAKAYASGELGGYSHLKVVRINPKIKTCVVERTVIL